MVKIDLYKNQLGLMNRTPAPAPEAGEDISKRYFKVITGLDEIPQNDMEAQKSLVKKALPGWKFLPEDKIVIKNLSGMGNSRTYLLTGDGGKPSQVIIHNKSIASDDHATIEAERRQEYIVK